MRVEKESREGVRVEIERVEKECDREGESREGVRVEKKCE